MIAIFASPGWPLTHPAETGLVSDTPAGNRRVYRVEPEALRRLRDHLDWYWERALAACQQAAEARARELGMAAEPEIVVAKTVRVNAPPAAAFEVFIGQQWWPVATHHLAEAPGVEAILEPFAGGRWYERAADGTETDWGTVLIWQPPHRLVLAFQVSVRWTREDDPDRAAQTEVTFTPEDPGVTRVDLTHRRLERYGDQAERMRRILDDKAASPSPPSPGSWRPGRPPAR